MGRIFFVIEAEAFALPLRAAHAENDTSLKEDLP
jgi:hypothetical protein